MAGKPTYEELEQRIKGLEKKAVERKRAEEDLRESEEKLTNIVESVTDAMIMVDEEFKVVWINDVAKGLFGADLVNKKCYSAYHGRDTVCEPCIAKQCFEDGKAHEFETEIVGVDGNRMNFWCTASVAAWHEDGRPRMVVEFLRDISERKLAEERLKVAYDQSIIYAEQLKEEISERKRAEEALRESEEKYRTITGAAQDAIVMMDNDGNLSYWNPAAEGMFGYTPEEAIGKELHIFLGPQRYHGAYRKGFKKFQGTGQGIVVGKTLELSAVRKDGTEFPIELSVSAMQLKDKWYATGIIRDISDRKLAEKEKEKLEAQLLQAQKMEAIGTLAGGIAHDFNNILQSILGYVQLLSMKKEVNDPYSRYLSQIDKSAQRASELTKQLLVFSRKVESTLRPMNLNQEVIQVHQLLRRTIPRMIDIQLDLAEDLKVINGDPVQLEQVMMNLGVNAMDAMPDGGNLIVETKNVVLDEEYCKSRLGAVPGEYVLLGISDTGCGMEKDILEHIFEPFYTTKETGKGTGLGLAMVYGIVKSHGGYITCYSEPGQGTVFKIYFPVLEGQDVWQKVDLENEAVIRGGREAVLFVDDEETLRDQGRDMLGEYGYTAITAEDGQTAIEIYKKEKGRIDLVILDVGMPGMGGHKCLEELFKIDPKVKVLVASGYASSDRVKKALESGAAGFISKPYHITDMLKKVRELLDQG